MSAPLSHPHTAYPAAYRILRRHDGIFIDKKVYILHTIHGYHVSHTIPESCRCYRCGRKGEKMFEYQGSVYSHMSVTDHAFTVSSPEGDWIAVRKEKHGIFMTASGMGTPLSDSSGCQLPSSVWEILRDLHTGSSYLSNHWGEGNVRKSEVDAVTDRELRLVADRQDGFLAVQGEKTVLPWGFVATIAAASLWW